MLPSLSSELSSWVGTSTVTEPFAIDAEHLREFGHATYLDPAFVDLTISRNNVLGPDLIDGFMLLSLLMHVEFAQQSLEREGVYGFNYGLDRVRFTHPVMVGQQIRYHRTIAEVDERTPTRFVITSQNTVEICESSEIAMYAEWKTMLIDGHAEVERGRSTRQQRTDEHDRT